MEHSLWPLERRQYAGPTRLKDGKGADVVESVPEFGRIYNVGRARLLVPLIVSTPLSNDPGMVSASKLDLGELSV